MDENTRLIVEMIRDSEHRVRADVQSAFKMLTKRIEVVEKRVDKHESAINKALGMGLIAIPFINWISKKLGG